MAAGSRKHCSTAVAAAYIGLEIARPLKSGTASKQVRFVGDSYPKIAVIGLPGGDRQGAAEGVVDLGGGVDAEGPEHRGGDVVGRDGVGRRVGADAVAGAVDRAAA